MDLAEVVDQVAPYVHPAARPLVPSARQASRQSKRLEAFRGPCPTPPFFILVGCWASELRSPKAELNCSS